jgi:hypothetical protein
MNLVHPEKRRGDMLTMNVHEAKTHLSSLLQGVARGDSFVIAKAGRPEIGRAHV